jgi:glyoxylate reductase
MSKPKVYVTRRIPDAGLQLLNDACDVRMWEGDTPPPRETLLAAVREAEGVLALLSESIDGELLDAAPNLKVVSNFAVGYDNIDIAAATARGIPVGNTPGVLTETTADLAFALLLSAARRLGESEQYVHEGKWKTWSPTLLLGQDVYGATLGLLGFGRIGQATARRGKGFGMRILYHGGSDQDAAREIGAEERSLDDLLKASDFISVHTPLNDNTYHLIDARALALMKPTAILVNTARGGIIDPAALYAALKDGVSLSGCTSSARWWRMRKTSKRSLDISTNRVTPDCSRFVMIRVLPVSVASYAGLRSTSCRSSLMSSLET